MERAKVAMLSMSAGMYDLPPHLSKLADSEEFWQALEATPEDALLPDQIAMMVALGVEPPPQRGSDRPK